MAHTRVNPLSFRDVPGDRQFDGRAVVGHGDRVSLKPTPGAAQPDDLVFQHDTFSAHDAPVQAFVCRPVLRSDKIHVEAPEQCAGGFRFDQRDPARIDLAYDPLRIKNLDRFWLVFDDGGEPSGAFLQLLLDVLALRDVDEAPERFAGCGIQRMAADFRPDFLAVLRDEPCFAAVDFAAR